MPQKSKQICSPIEAVSCSSECRIHRTSSLSIHSHFPLTHISSWPFTLLKTHLPFPKRSFTPSVHLFLGPPLPLHILSASLPSSHLVCVQTILNHSDPAALSTPLPISTSFALFPQHSLLEHNLSTSYQTLALLSQALATIPFSPTLPSDADGSEV